MLCAFGFFEFSQRFSQAMHYICLGCFPTRTDTSASLFNCLGQLVLKVINLKMPFYTTCGPQIDYVSALVLNSFMYHRIKNYLSFCK